MVEVDDIVGRLTKTLEETGQADNTFVFFTSDNGPEEDSYPDSGFTPFRSGKGTTWEGGVRVPGIAYWPGMIKPGRVSDGLFDHHGFVQHLAGPGRYREQNSDRTLHRRRQPDEHFCSQTMVTPIARRCSRTIRPSFSAIRWANFKGYFKVVQIDQPFSNISMSTFAPVAVAPWIFDIYRDPKERLTRSNGDYEWIYGPILQLQTAHAATFIKYPKKDIGLGVGGDPR